MSSNDAYEDQSGAGRREGVRPDTWSSARNPAPGVSTRDVARIANVSRGTVSNVLNHPDRVSPARREAVQDAIRELGFVRHEGARHLRAGYSTTVGLLLLDAWNPGFIDIAHGVEDTTIACGLSVLISNSARDSTREESYLRLYTERRVAGLIVIPHDRNRHAIRRIRAGGMPVVVVDQDETADPQSTSVSTDDITGGTLVATHLIELGHTHLAFIGDPDAAVPVRARLTGVQNAISTAKAPITLSVINADLDADSGRLVGAELAKTPTSQRPTGLIAAIDLVAFGAMQGLLQHGIRIPEDLSLVGYDDIPFSRQLSVPLTTIKRPHYRMGSTAAKLLVEIIGGQTPATPNVVYQPTLIVRESTGKPPPGDRAGR